MLSKFGGGGDKKIEKKWVLGEKLESMNYKGRKIVRPLQGKTKPTLAGLLIVLPPTFSIRKVGEGLLFFFSSGGVCLPEEVRFSLVGFLGIRVSVLFRYFYSHFSPNCSNAAFAAP